MPTLFWLTTAITAGVACLRLLPPLAAGSLMTVLVPAAALLMPAPVVIGLVLGAAGAGVWAYLERRDARSGQAPLERAQKEAEQALDAIAGVPGTAYHEDLAIAAMLSAIEADDPEDQMAGFREAVQLARQGLATATARA